jgi:hypothetical protein
MNTMRALRVTRLSTTIAGLVLILGCGGGSGAARPESTSRANSEFPSSSEIEDMMRTAPMQSRGGFGDAERSRARFWSLEGLLPASAGSTEIASRTPWQVSAKEAFPRTLLTDELTCAAEQFARYHGEHREAASGALRDFILLRCGAASENVSVGLSWLDNSDANSFWGRNGATVMADRSAGHQDSPDNRMGVWVGDVGGRVYFAMAHEAPEAHLDPVPFAVTGTTVRVQGRLLSNYDRIGAYVTQGEWDANLCTVDESVSLPEFAVDCDVNRNDPMTTVALYGWRRGRFLGSQLSRVLVSPRGMLPSEFEIRDLNDGSAWGATTGSVAQRITQLVNVVRSEADREPIELLPEQSDVNERLMPMVINRSDSSQSERAADDASLAVLAGHRVPERIVDAGLVIRSVQQQNLGTGFLSSLEFDPSARAALLAESTNSLAVGHSAQDAYDAVFISSYSYFVPENLDRLEERFIERVNAARRAAGDDDLRPPPEGMRVLMQAAGGSLAINEYTVTEVQQIVAQRASAVLGTSVRVYVQFAENIDDLPLPPQLLAGRTRAAVDVSSYASPTTNWASYIVIFLVW